MCECGILRSDKYVRCGIFDTCRLVQQRQHPLTAAAAWLGAVIADHGVPAMCFALWPCQLSGQDTWVVHNTFLEISEREACTAGS